MHIAQWHPIQTFRRFLNAGKFWAILMSFGRWFQILTPSKSKEFLPYFTVLTLGSVSCFSDYAEFLHGNKTYQLYKGCDIQCIIWVLALLMVSVRYSGPLWDVAWSKLPWHSHEYWAGDAWGAAWDTRLWPPTLCKILDVFRRENIA